MTFPQGFGIGLLVSPAGTGSGGLPPSNGINAVNFDGTNDYLTRGAGLTGAADSKTGIFSCWVKRATTGTPTFTMLVMQEIAGTDRLNMNIGDNVFKCLLYNTAGTVIMQARSTTSILVADGWTHILASWDLSVPVVHVYIDDGEDANVLTLTNDTINYTRSEAGVGHIWLSSTPGFFKFDGDMAELYFQDGEFLDFSVEANRRKFIDAMGKPVGLGADGSTPTGSVPLVFQSGATDEWHTNKGSGGGFTEVGALTDASSSPSD